MKFKVLSRKKVEQYNVKEKHLLISFRDVGSEVPNFPVNDNRVECLMFEFTDLNSQQVTRMSDESIKKNKVKLFDKDSAKEIWDVVYKYKDEIKWIIVHCEVGISRSAGAVAALSKIMNGTDEYFFKHFIPNMLVYKLILNEGMDRDTI